MSPNLTPYVSIALITEIYEILLSTYLKFANDFLYFAIYLFEELVLDFPSYERSESDF